MTDPLEPFDAILLLSYGGPRGHEDVLPFMRNATRGRNVPDSRLEMVSVHYKKFDGVSPINARMDELIEGLSMALRAKGSTRPVLLGNRNWTPFMVDTLREAHAQGLRHFLIMPTAAYSSYSGCRQYREDVAEAVETLRQEGIDGFRFSRVPAYYHLDGLIRTNAQAVIEAVREASAASTPEGGEDDETPTVIFITHSIPLDMNEASGPQGQTNVYEAQHAEHYAAVMANVEELHGGPVPWTFGYSSRSGPPHQPWQEPDIVDMLEDMYADGIRRVVICPAGYLFDHMEVVYDLDTEAAEAAAELGMVYKRTRTAGVHPFFMNDLADWVLQAATIADTSCSPQCCKSAPTAEMLPAVCGQD
ncbi:ferrochelatase [Stomatohabitans albus]|uniref:ferrochelatase n=1 Tax=Stomatohabitans albus TaxID=3110766 RepID=UPI00300CC170